MQEGQAKMKALFKKYVVLSRLLFILAGMVFSH